jgi:hypothetical protein
MERCGRAHATGDGSMSNRARGAVAHAGQRGRRLLARDGGARGGQVGDGFGDCTTGATDTTNNWGAATRPQAALLGTRWSPI